MACVEKMCFHQLHNKDYSYSEYSASWRYGKTHHYTDPRTRIHHLMAVCSQPSKMGFDFVSLGKHHFLMGHERMSWKINPHPVLEKTLPLQWKGQKQNWWLSPVYANYLLDLCVHRLAFTSVSEVYIIPGHLMQSPHCKGLKGWVYIVRS